MWVRISQAAEEEGDFERALESLGHALTQDPKGILALTLRTDILAGGDDAAELARGLEAEARSLSAAPAQARGWLSAAYVWSVRAAEVDLGRQALAKAVELGVDPTVSLELARSFAVLAEEDAWYEQATDELVQKVEDPERKATLAWELGRLRWRRGDVAGASEAFAALAEDEEPSRRWLGRALLAYAVQGDDAREPARLRGLAEVDEDPYLARGLNLMAALLAFRTGDKEQALTLLRSEHEKDPSDLVVAAFLADIARESDAKTEAAAALRAAAAVAPDGTIGGALNIEAGLLEWHAGNKAAALEAFESALGQTPEAAQRLLPWALRAAAPEDLDARVRAVDAGEELDGDEVAAAIERFGIGLAAREGQADPVGALDRLDELSPGGDVAMAAILARLITGAEADRALEQLADLDGAAPAIARAEQFRLARFVNRDAVGSVEAARQWHDVAPHLTSALEWLAAAFAADDRDAEIEAREAIAAQMSGQDAVSAAASAAVVRMLHSPGRTQALLDADAEAARLLNLELTLPGGEPGRRAHALRSLGDSLGEDAAQDAARMAAWNDLAAAAYGEAQKAFRGLVEADADDMASWDGLRASSEAIGDHTTRGVALARLGNLTKDDARAAALWEEAGLVLLEHTEAHADAEIAFARSLERDQTRFVAFDKLFRRVRKRKENDRLLKLIELRLEVTDDETEITKMYWERARVFREQGDQDAALQSLNDVTMLEPDHVGALALSGEISIKKGDFAGAAPLLARLATLDDAPRKQRLLSGIAAVDLYEKRLKEPQKALGVLLQLYKDGLSTLKVRERLARTAARVGNYDDATTVLERLMGERDSSEGRAEAARLAMALYRDKLKQPQRAAKAVAKLLEEVPDHKEALELLLEADVSPELTRNHVPKALQLLLNRLASQPFDRERVELVGKIATRLAQPNLRRAAIGVARALGNDDATLESDAQRLDALGRLEPQIKLDAGGMQTIADDADSGVIAEVFRIAAPAMAEALGLTTKAEDVGRRQRVESGALRTELSRWTGALSLGDFELYVGGRDPRGITGIPGDKPALVLGPEIQAPFSPAVRSAIAREVFALVRGTSVLLHNDDATVASAFVAVCRDAGNNLPNPPYAVFGEIERQVKKAMSRRIRKAVAPVAASAGGNMDAAAWAAAARRSIDRMGLIASGDASNVIDRAIGPPGSPARAAMDNDLRAKQLLSFALSSEYLKLRKQLGMGVA